MMKLKGSLPMPALKLIIWDLDGTLTDSAEGILNAVSYAVRQMKLSPLTPEEARQFIGPPLHLSFQNHFSLTDREARRAVDIFREYYREKGIWENKPYGGVRETLEKLKKRGILLAVATAKPLLFARRVLSHFDLECYFSVIEGSCFDERKTDKYELIGGALERLDFYDMKHALMVGDRHYDILGAQKCGILSCAAAYGYGTAKEWALADFCIDSPEGILSLLR
jgi:phosphoglycolate phosphatase